MKRVHIVIEAGKVNLDFNGFPGDTCSSEENMIRALYGKMGVETDFRKASTETPAGYRRSRSGSKGKRDI